MDGTVTSQQSQTGHQREAASIVFEQPLNERYRSIMRLETLFRQADFGIHGDDEWHSRLAVDTLASVLEVLSRGDLRSEVIKELERVSGILAQLGERPGVDSDRVHYFVGQCSEIVDRLRSQPGQLGSALRRDELLNSVIQRSGIAGGTCGFDLPAYHRWLQQPAGRRREALEDWYAVLDGLRQACDLLLRLMRDSAMPQSQTAVDGIYQRNLERGTSVQLISVELPADTAWFAEVSGNKHFVTVRFMEPGFDQERAFQTDRDVEFILRCCML